MTQIQMIALRIADLRDILGLSQEEVAAKSQIPLEEYVEYEKGEKDFSFSHLFNIAETLGVDISDLLTRRIQRNYRFIMTFNSALILLGAFGVLPASTSAWLHNLSTLAISADSMSNLLPEEGSENAVRVKA